MQVPHNGVRLYQSQVVQGIVQRRDLSSWTDFSKFLREVLLVKDGHFLKLKGDLVDGEETKNCPRRLNAQVSIQDDFLRPLSWL